MFSTKGRTVFGPIETEEFFKLRFEQVWAQFINLKGIFSMHACYL